MTCEHLKMTCFAALLSKKELSKSYQIIIRLLSKHSGCIGIATPMQPQCNPHATLCNPHATGCIFGGQHPHEYKKAAQRGSKCFTMSLVLLVVDNADRVEFVIYQRFQTKKEPRLHCINITEISWRRARDSNPRSRFDGLHDFQSCSFDQLGQLSVCSTFVIIL